MHISEQQIINNFVVPYVCRLSDLVGADIGLHVGKNFLESFADRTYPARIIALLNEHKRLGEKAGRGGACIGLFGSLFGSSVVCISIGSVV
jgi:hypothetical protein